MELADLHVHTTASDGTVKPSEIVKKAIEGGLKAVAITDHDTIDGIEEAYNEALKYKHFTLVPGIEISTTFEGQEVHVLGYFIDYNDANLIKKLQELKQQREIRGKKIIQKLEKMGIYISMEKLKNIVGNGTIGRPHIAQALVNSGYSKDVQMAFDKYLIKGSPAYVPRQKLLPSEAIDLIKKAKGITVLAHPIFLKDKEQILRVLNFGFDGIEVEYPNHSNEFRGWLNKVAKKLGLIGTGGSDFHGEIKAVELGDSTVEFKVVKKLLQLKGEKFK